MLRGMGSQTGIDAFTAALVDRLAQFEATRAPDPAMIAAAANAPPAAAALLEVLAPREVVNVALGWRSVWDPGLGRFADSLENMGGPPAGFDPAKSLELGASGGGEVQFGIHWNGGIVEWMEIDPEVGITRFADGEAFFRHVLADEQNRLLDRKDRGKGDLTLPPALTALFAAAGSPVAAQAP